MKTYSVGKEKAQMKESLLERAFAEIMPEVRFIDVTPKKPKAKNKRLS